MWFTTVFIKYINSIYLLQNKLHKPLIMKTLNNQKVQVVQVSFALVDTNDSESQEDQQNTHVSKL